MAAIEAAQLTPEKLLELGLLRDAEKPLKVLGDGDLKAALHISAHKVSESARQKIEAAGGSVTILEASNEPRRSKGRTEAPVRAMKARQASESVVVSWSVGPSSISSTDY